MTHPNRYDDVADLYDLYVDVESDLAFFRQMAERAGLQQVESFGDYDRSPFEPDSSPCFISVFEKRREGT